MKSTAPTLASAMTTSSVARGMAGGTPLAAAAIRPMPLASHQGGQGASRRASGMPMNGFHSPSPAPFHLAHPAKI